MGWLHSTPDTTDGEPRIKTYGDGDLAVSMPKTDLAVVALFHSCGINQNYGMGAFPFTWGEIESFSNMQETPLSQWECEQLSMMSREYCSFVIKGGKKDCESPWDSEEYTSEMAIQHDRDRVVNAMMKKRAERKLIMQK